MKSEELKKNGIYSSVGLSEFVNPLIDSAADTQ